MDVSDWDQMRHYTRISAGVDAIPIVVCWYVQEGKMYGHVYRRLNEEGSSDHSSGMSRRLGALVAGSPWTANIDRLNCYLSINQKRRKEYRRLLCCINNKRPGTLYMYTVNQLWKKKISFYRPCVLWRQQSIASSVYVRSQCVCVCVHTLTICEI